MSCDSAKGMFDKLCSIYERDSSHNKSSLLQNFLNYKIYKVAPVDDETMMGKILSSLPDRYRHFLTAWDSTPKSDRALANLTARLLAEEERVHTSSTHDNVAFKTVNKNIVCFKCNKRGHIARNCINKQLDCKICKADNHTEQNCYFRDRNNKSTTSNWDKVAFLTESMGGNPEGFWVLYSGCTYHIINNSDSLTNVTGIESENITSKKNENMCAELKDYAPVATPQLNGRADRLNRMLMEKTRALIFDSGLKKELWGEALCTEKSPSATVYTTLAELWYGKRLDLSNLKLFGSLAYAKKLKKLGKLDKICDKLIMVGYATNGHRLWNSEKREIKLSRKVTFEESTEVSVTNNSSQEIIADTVSLVDSEETSLRLVDNMKGRRITTVLQDNVVDEPFQNFPSDKDTAKISEVLDSLPETTTEIENCNHQGRKERIKRKPEYFQEYLMLSYKEAISGEDKDKWLKAIEFTARLFARGREQKAGLDYSETFSSVVSLDSLRFLIVYTKKETMSLKQFDIKTAFLYSNLEQDVFMLVPEGFENEQCSVVKLRKSVYGLKQAPRAWNR
ncbi:hypothetical protein PR048_020299 [Dryococelus australis]|uniref:CCHC-type domain-containing protein n=1 Tax=Dryococelus australis TaxID=614101 RepID=A0ABQ9H5X0_9NEOP|nr:hypothetical protein PR048_020299 [Dryococelus australis]